MSNEHARKERSKKRKEGKEAWLIGPLLFRLYGVLKRGSFRSIIRNVVLHLEGGGHYSRTIRRIFSVYHQVEIGMYTSGPCSYPPRCFPSGTKIGRYSGVYEETVRFFGADHPMDRISTHALFYNPKLGYANGEADIERRGVIIGNDVFIGHNVTIVASAHRIGDGAVVGAGSVVTRDVPDYAVVVGNPAKVIKYRFSKETQLKIKASKWWDKDIEELRKDFDKFAMPLEDGKDIGI